MSLDRILQTLEAEAEQQLSELNQAAQVELERIRSQAQAEARKIRQKHLASSQALLQIERTRLLNRAKLAALQIELNARETLISSALTAVARRLTALCESEAYPKLLRQLTREAVETLGANQQFRLHVRADDVELMECIVRELGLEATVTEDFFEQTGEAAVTLENNHLGGTVATTADGRIRLTNTLQTRLQRVANLYRAQIAEIIFDDVQEG